MRSTAEQQQLRRLRQSRAVATGMLAVAAAIFVASLAVPAPNAWVLLVRSVAGGAFVVVDLGSTNATLVNGSPIAEHGLADGDQITIGNTVLEFRRG